MLLVLSLIVLAAALAAAVRPAPEAVVACAGAGLLLITGAVSPAGIGHTAAELGPTIGFLAALLLLSEGCRDAGLFRAIGEHMAVRAGSSPRRLLGLVFLAGSLVTAILNLDAAVVLITPVVLATLAGRPWARDPHLFAVTHLSNSASLLMPVSNLTNLLAFRASGLSFTRFTAVMALPWLAALAAEYLIFRVAFRRDLAGPEQPVGDGMAPARVPRFAAAVVVLSLAGFVVVPEPAWVAVAGAVALALGNRPGPAALLRALQPGFLLFVFALGVIVQAAAANGLGEMVADVLPRGDHLQGLLAIAGVAALTANLLNNLPATLLLVPVAAAGGPVDVLAVLLGVNLGPNLTPVGSLATLLWARVLRATGQEPHLGRLFRLGLVSVPVTLAASGLALWLARPLL